MPRNTRQWAKQELDRAIGNLDWYMSHLDHIGATYYEAHPEISDKILNLIQLADQLKEFTSDLERSL